MPLTKVRAELVSGEFRMPHTVLLSEELSGNFNSKGGGGNETLGNAAGGKGKRLLGGWGRGALGGKALLCQSREKVTQGSLNQQRGKVFPLHHTPCPAPSQNSRPGFPTCRALRPKEERGGEKSRHGAATRLGGWGAECKGEEASSPGNCPGARAVVTSSQATFNTDL